MHILMISGVWTDPNVDWDLMRDAFRRNLPHATFSHETEPWVNAYEVQRLEEFVERLARAYDVGGDMVLMGHSLGGLLACALEPRMVRTKVVGIATIFAPNQTFGRMLRRMYRADSESSSVMSFEAMRDEVVLWGSRHPRAIRHEYMYSNHFSDLMTYPDLNEYIARIVIETWNLRHNRVARE